MELGEGRGGLLGEEDPLYIVGGKIQPLSPLSARALQYYRIRATVLLQEVAVLPLQGAVL